MPSERAQARKLRHALTAAFQRAPMGIWPDKLELEDEVELLDQCMQQLVKQLAPRCLEWAGTVEVLRGRYSELWARVIASGIDGAPLTAETNPSPSEPEPSVSAEVYAAAKAQTEQLELELFATRSDLAAARRAAVEAAASLARVPEQVPALEAELHACQELLAERRQRDVAETAAGSARKELIALETAAASVADPAGRKSHSPTARPVIQIALQVDAAPKIGKR